MVSKMPAKKKPVKYRRGASPELQANTRASAAVRARSEAAAVGSFAELEKRVLASGAERGNVLQEVAQKLAIVREEVGSRNAAEELSDWLEHELAGLPDTHPEELECVACMSLAEKYGTTAQVRELFVGYPEHEKLRAVADESQACGEFFEWLTTRYTIGQYHKHNEDCAPDGVDVCGMARQTLYPTSVNVRKLLAEFFEIDETKLEDEKRAMLAALKEKA